jgi:hypothetical protein
MHPLSSLRLLHRFAVFATGLACAAIMSPATRAEPPFASAEGAVLRSPELKGALSAVRYALITVNGVRSRSPYGYCAKKDGSFRLTLAPGTCELSGIYPQGQIGFKVGQGPDEFEVISNEFHLRFETEAGHTYVLDLDVVGKNWWPLVTDATTGRDIRFTRLRAAPPLRQPAPRADHRAQDAPAGFGTLVVYRFNAQPLGRKVDILVNGRPVCSLKNKQHTQLHVKAGPCTVKTQWGPSLAGAYDRSADITIQPGLTTYVCVEGNVHASSFAPGIAAQYLEAIEATLADGELPACASVAPLVGRIGD